MIDVRGLSKTYVGGSQPAVTALDRVDLSVAQGEVVLVMGPSGSGKSTLLALIGGMMAPSAGSVRVAGENVHALGHADRTAFRLRRVGFVFQRFRLLEALTVSENVALVLRLAGTSRDAARDRAADLLDQVGMAHRSGHFPRTLSGGEQQRVAVARALANDPAVVLADEPTGSLDMAAGDGIMRLLRAAAEQGKGVLIASHDLRIRDYAHHTIHLEDGRRRGP